MTRRFIRTPAVVGLCLLLGGCAAAVQTKVLPLLPQAPPTTETVEVEVPLIELPVRPLVFTELLGQPLVGYEELAQPACDVLETARNLRETMTALPLTVGSREYRYTEVRGGAPRTYKDPEKTIHLGLVNPLSCETDIVTIRKRGDDLVAPDGYVIEAVRRANGIRWNNWATEYAVESPSDWIVGAVVYPYVTDEKFSRQVRSRTGRISTVTQTREVTLPVFYVPFGPHLQTQGVVERGRAYMDDLVAQAYAELRALKVPSRAVPGTLVADVEAIHPSDLASLGPNEHMDETEFLLDPVYTASRVYSLIAANGAEYGRYTCSKASACGLMQFTTPTYRDMVKFYPTARLMADTLEGRRDHLNSMKAAILLWDSQLAIFIDRLGAGIAGDARLPELQTSAYNTGPGRTASVYQVSLDKNIGEWTEAKGRDCRRPTYRQCLLPETKGYIAKRRFLASDWLRP
jgi:hypothetical protein